MNLTLKHFSQATTKPRIIKNLRIAKIQRTCISIHCLCFAFHSVWVMKLNWLVSFIFCLFLISFTFCCSMSSSSDVLGVLYSWHRPYSQQAFCHWKKTFQCIRGFVKPVMICQRKRKFWVKNTLTRMWMELCGTCVYSKIRKVKLDQHIYIFSDA